MILIVDAITCIVVAVVIAIIMLIISRPCTSR